MENRNAYGRRSFLGKSGAFLAVSLAGGVSPLWAGKREDEIPPTEDLMREHGVLDRLVLIYEEAIRRIDISSDMPPDVLPRAGNMVRRFVEDYHEKQEEKFIFPWFRKAGKFSELVEVLQQQHASGRKLTDTTMHLASLKGIRDPRDDRLLISSMRMFIRMYRPHAAREETVLFPALRSIIKESEFEALGEMFEKKEHSLLGENSFRNIVDQVEELEKKLQIYDISNFNPMA